MTNIVTLINSYFYCSHMHWMASNSKLTDDALPEKDAAGGFKRKLW